MVSLSRRRMSTDNFANQESSLVGCDEEQIVPTERFDECKRGTACDVGKKGTG